MYKFFQTSCCNSKDFGLQPSRPGPAPSLALSTLEQSRGVWRSLATLPQTPPDAVWGQSGGVWGSLGESGGVWASLGESGRGVANPGETGRDCAGCGDSGIVSKLGWNSCESNSHSLPLNFKVPYREVKYRELYKTGAGFDFLTQARKVRLLLIRRDWFGPARLVLIR